MGTKGVAAVLGPRSAAASFTLCASGHRRRCHLVSRVQSTAEGRNRCIPAEPRGSSDSGPRVKGTIAGHLTQSLPYCFSVHVLIHHYYRYGPTSDVYGTAVSAAVTIVFSNAVRTERSDRPTPYDTNKCPATAHDRRHAPPPCCIDDTAVYWVSCDNTLRNVVHV